ncbi:MAG: hypothetical protein H7249_01995 [Chitinophagaceae bacterium]|nr:hypothetical protein [Oligoflexus sp.]
MKPWLVSLALFNGAGLLCAPLACSEKGEHQGGHESSVKEAPDSANAVSLFQIKAMPTYEDILATKQVFTPRIPWSDTYWPLSQAGLARRWGAVSTEVSPLGFSSYWRDELSSAGQAVVDPHLSPAEKYDLLYRLRYQNTFDPAKIKADIAKLSTIELGFASTTTLLDRRQIVNNISDQFDRSPTLRAWSPMASDGWMRWLWYTKNSQYQFLNEEGSGDDWSWMGYCHGWAAASLMHNVPKHAVMVTIDNTSVLLGEGDIRGLLTKAWADHPPQTMFFLGRRCNENTPYPSGTIPSSTADNHGATGTYTDASGQTFTFTMMDEYLPGGAFNGRRIYQVEVDKIPGEQFLIENTVPGGVQYYLSTEFALMKKFVETGAIDGLASVKAVKFYGCWDVNPASLQTLLTEYLGKKQLGFIMDRTRTGQVWNQPIYGARFNVGPLLDAGSTVDPLYRYRAIGTAYLSVVKTDVIWTTEPPAPSLTYPDNFDINHVATSRYTYTLEFDVNHQLIGGEWGDLNPPQKNLVTPDFLFAFKPGSEPLDALNYGFDYSGIIKPIYSCSQNSGPLKSIQVDGVAVDYTDCVVSKSPSFLEK